MLKTADPLDDLGNESGSNEDAQALYDKIMSAVDQAFLNVVKGLIKHNLEQLWWTKLSKGEVLDPGFYKASVEHVEKVGSSRGPEIAQKVKGSMRVENNNVVYDFPFDRSEFLGEFTLEFPSKIETPLETVKNLDTETLGDVLCQEYSKWLGTHILF